MDLLRYLVALGQHDTITAINTWCTGTDISFPANYPGGWDGAVQMQIARFA